MFNLRPKKFTIEELKKGRKMDPKLEVTGLTSLLNIRLEEEDYESAAIIRDRLVTIKNDTSLYLQ